VVNGGPAEVAGQIREAIVLQYNLNSTKRDCGYYGYHVAPETFILYSHTGAPEELTCNV